MKSSHGSRPPNEIILQYSRKIGECQSERGTLLSACQYITKLSGEKVPGKLTNNEITTNIEVRTLFIERDVKPTEIMRFGTVTLWHPC